MAFKGRGHECFQPKTLPEILTEGLILARVAEHSVPHFAGVPAMPVTGADLINRLTQLCVVAGAALVPIAPHSADDDPWEDVKRVIYRFNDTLDTYTLKR